MRLKLFSLMVLAALVLGACAQPATEAPEESGESGGGTLYFIAKVAGIPYFEQNSYPAAREASEELGYEIIINSPAQPEAAEQIELIDSAIAQQVDAILISANDAEALCPSLKEAMDQGIHVVSWDSDVQTDCRELFQQQADPEQVGRTQVQIMCELLGGPGECEGQVAILSAAPTMTNQNTWIEWMEEEWKKPEYSGMDLVATVYGDDVDQKSYNETLGLIKSHPDLKGIISPTSVGVAAAARAVEDRGLEDQIEITGLGLPNQLREYIKRGTIGKAALWNPKDQAYLTVYMADALITGEIEGEEGDTFEAGKLGDYTVQEAGVVVLGPPLEFDADNVDDYDF